MSFQLPAPPYLPEATAKISNLALYQSTQPLWINPGVPIIIGTSPNDIAALINAPILRDPNYNTTPSITTVPSVQIFALDSNIGNSSVSFGQAPLNQGQGVAPDGNVWAWAISVELYLAAISLPFQHQIGLYTGNGTSQTINVPFATSAQVNAVIVKPLTGDGFGGAFRHSGMLTAGITGYGGGLNNQTITSLGSSSFTIGNDLTVNENGIKYCYIAFSDPSNQYMLWGSYHGSGAGQTITTHQSAKSNPPTHVFLWGRDNTYRSTDFANSNDCVLCAEYGSSNPITNLITSLTSTGFVVGNDVNVDAGSLTYYWLVFCSDASLAAQTLNSGTYVGNGSNTVSGIPFQPGLACTQQIRTGIFDAIYRVLNGQSGTHSSGWGTNNGSTVEDYPSTGVTSLTSNGFTTGSDSSGNAQTIVWFAFSGSSNITGGPTGLGTSCPATVGLRNGVVGFPYHGQLGASGGTPPYVFVLTGGSMPNGLTFHPDGSITGIPTVAGSTQFQFQVFDHTFSSGSGGSGICTITIDPAANIGISNGSSSSGGGNSGCIDTHTPPPATGGSGCIEPTTPGAF